MRLIVLYDLPTNSKSDIRIASKFRNELIKKGFIMMQESIYVKQCINHDSLNRTYMYIEKILPIKGDVRSIAITEKQYMDMKLLKGKKSNDEKISEMGTLILL